MNIKHVRLVLPTRMRHTAQVDARTIAEAVARALHAKGATEGPIRLQVHGHGRPASLIAQDVTRELRNKTPKRGD